MSAKSGITWRFQSTLPRGERPKCPINRTVRAGFQSTLPRGERPSGLIGLPWTDAFQSTLPRGERPNMTQDDTAKAIFQSTLPRGERRYNCRHSHHVWFISIHAPARGATSGQAGADGTFAISIHAPARGATYSQAVAAAKYRNFNPRSREGSDSNNYQISKQTFIKNSQFLSLSHPF